MPLELSEFKSLSQRWASRTSRITTLRGSLTTRPVTDKQPGAGRGYRDVPAVAAGVVRDTTLIELASMGTCPHRYHVCTLYLHRIHRWRVRVERPPTICTPWATRQPPEPGSMGWLAGWESSLVDWRSHSSTPVVLLAQIVSTRQNGPTIRDLQVCQSKLHFSSWTRSLAAWQPGRPTQLVLSCCCRPLTPRPPRPAQQPAWTVEVAHPCGIAAGRMDDSQARASCLVPGERATQSTSPSKHGCIR